MKIKSIVPYYGGKRKMAGQIIELLGKHEMYFEPFCGSFAVLLAKKPSNFETAIDLDGRIANLVTVLADTESAQQLFTSMAHTLFSDDRLHDAQIHLATVDYTYSKIPNVPWAYQFMCASWMQRNGMAGLERDCSLAVRWTKGGGSPTTRWQGVIDSVPAWCKRLQNVVMLNRSAFEVIPNITDKPDTAIYCDPPYPLSTRSTGGGNHYVHDFQESHDGLFQRADEHEALADQLNEFKHARIVVSTYQNDKYDRLYADWEKINCKVMKNMAAQNKRGKAQLKPKMAPEVMFVKGGK